MFRLSKLEITGFKSFADYTEIIFTGDGITAVVGPNGCGKSNVADAISWVLGEQSAKNLRGGEMQDVIFQGAKNRSAGGMAEVILHLVRDNSPARSAQTDDIDLALHDFDEKSAEISFDAFAEKEPSESSDNENLTNSNTQGYSLSETNGTAVALQTPRKRAWQSKKVSLDFAPGETVSVTRRLYRSGESEYQLNGKNCRLRDINDLFSGTGLSGGHYAIIEQGKIGQILSAKPSERRGLIEEAAGVTKFRMRQRAAELRLEAAKTNLRRIADIVSEVERTTNSLRRQAAKTKRYKVLRDDYRSILQKLFVGELIDIENELQAVIENLRKASEVEKEFAQKLFAAENGAAQNTENARLAEQQLADWRETISENNLRRDRQSRELVYLKERRDQFEKQIAAFSAEIKSLETRRENALRDAASLAEKNKNQQNQTALETEEIARAEQIFNSKSAVVRQAESRTETFRTALLQHSNAFERLREIIRQNDYSRTRLKERLEGLQKERERAAQTEAEKLAENERFGKEAETSREKITLERQQQQKRLQKLQDLRKDLQEAERKFRGERDEYSRLNNRFQTLRELETKNAFYAPNVQKLFTLQNKISAEFVGVAGDFINVGEEFEKAVEAVFGDKLQTIILKSAEDARRVAAFLQTNNIGRFSFAIADLQTLSGEDKTKNSARRTIFNIAELREGFPYKVFEKELSAEIIEDISAADSNLCVTKRGEIVENRSFYVAGQQNAAGNSKGILAFKRELSELETETEKALQRRENAQEILSTAKISNEETERVYNEASKNLQIFERELLSAEMREKSSAQEIERAKRHSKVVADEIAQISKELEEIAARRTKTEQDLSAAESAKIEAEQNIGKVGAELKNLRDEAARANTELSKKRAEFAAANERRRSLSNALRRVEQELNEIAARLEREKVNWQNALKEIGLVKEKISETETLTVAISEDKVQETLRLNELTANLQTARQKSDESAQHLKELNQDLANARNARGDLEVRQASLQTKLENLRANCRHELNVLPEELRENVALGELFDVADEKAEAEALREKLENFGAVNMLALEELNEAEERLLFLTSQKKDIVDSINSANKALEEIKRRSRERFQHAFNEINRNFTEIFSQVFGGGSGAMNLLEAEDILESGIEIVAQPPGKRLQSLLLLSGGEKAMTAIALILAIFRFRPSPFCLLDEVDAPLDEANVGRFIENVAAMSDETQFIVITHNKRTMESAKALYGVTMEQAGISKVVSVKFN